ncbi:hypothetical protein [Phocaeicola faecalis]
MSKLNRPIPSSAVGAGFACPKTQSKLFSGERTSPLRTKRQHYSRFDTTRYNAGIKSSGRLLYFIYNALKEICMLTL